MPQLFVCNQLCRDSTLLPRVQRRSAGFESQRLFKLAKTHEKFVNCLELGFQTLRVDIECILVVLIELYSRLDSVFEAVTRHSKAPCRVGRASLKAKRVEIVIYGNRWDQPPTLTHC